MSEATWEFLRFGIQVLLVPVLGVIGYFLKRTLDALEKRLCRLEERDKENAVGGAVVEGKIREKLAAGYVSVEACRACDAEKRETQTRLFGKVEDLQKGQARMEGKVDTLTTVAGGAFQALAALAARDEGGRHE